MAVTPWGADGDAWRVEQYNEGCGLWLYDDAHRDQLKASGAPLLAVDEAGLSPAELKTIRTLTRRGLLRICELHQDDSLDLVVFTAGLPGDERLRFGRWYPPFHGKLALPSGKLAIEGANALGITGEYDPDEPGDVVDVTPGDYVVSLFNMHWEQLRDELPDYMARGSAPWQVVALTPADAFRGRLDERPFWPWVPSLPRPDWVGDYTVSGGVFRGLYNAPDYWDSLRINLDPRAATTMCLEPGEILSVRTDLGEIRALYRGDAPEFRHSAQRPVVDFGGHNETAGAYLHPDRDAGVCMWVYRWETDALCFRKRAAWRPVTVERWRRDGD